MVVLTGDAHGRSERIEAFCAEFGLTEGDVLVILGNAGINYWLNEWDKALKERLSRLPVTLQICSG